MRLFLVIVMAIVGALFGLWVGLQTVTRVYPLPHHIPKYEGGVSLRFAMVHDVIHERYPKHGRAYYEERNRLARRAIEQADARSRPEEAPTPAYFALKDDLGVGLERLGQHEAAVSLMRDKLKQQKAVGLKGRDLYSTKANLGTFLILWQMELGFADLPATKQRLNEGLILVRESMTDNPEAHYGREMWQAVLLEFFLASLDDPTLLTRFDMVGNRWDTTIDPAGKRCFTRWEQWGGMGENRNAALYLKQYSPEKFPGWDSGSATPSRMREAITKVGAEENWPAALKSSSQKPVPFDEPTLGIVGMWRYGGGANPHFARALGEILLRIGQRHIAWCAYERAASLSDHFSPDPADTRKFLHHCRNRQDCIEATMPGVERSQLRSRFEKELAFGNHYQTLYQEFEAERIRDGTDLSDPHFYEPFDAQQDAIASHVGAEDQFLVVHDYFSNYLDKETRAAVGPRPAIIIVCAGLFAFGTACLLRLLDWCVRRLRVTAPPVPSLPPPSALPPGAATWRS